MRDKIKKLLSESTDNEKRNFNALVNHYADIELVPELVARADETLYYRVYDDAIIAFSNNKTVPFNDHFSDVYFLEDIENDNIEFATKDEWYNIDLIRKEEFNMPTKQNKKYL